MTVGVFSWPTLENTAWIATAMWYSSLLLAIIALITSTQQSTLLQTASIDRRSTTSSVDDIQRHLRFLLASPKKAPTSIPSTNRLTPRSDLERNILTNVQASQPSWFMLFYWQCPMMLMSYSWVAFLLALTLHVCAPFMRPFEPADSTKAGPFSRYL